MKRFFCLAALFGTALLFTGCSDTSDFPSDTLENTQTLSKSFKNRGTAACNTIQEMEADNRLVGLQFPKVDFSKSHDLLLDLSQKLADEFVGSSAKKTKTTSGVSFTKDSKVLTVDETKYEISFVDQKTSSDNQNISPQDVLSKTKSFISSHKELGSANDYYVSNYMGGSYSRTGYLGPEGKPIIEPIHQEAAEIKINRVVNNIPVLGGIGAIRFSLHSDQSVAGFKIKFLQLSVGNNNYSGADLIGYKEAEQKAREVLNAQQQDGSSFEFMCEFGYIPDSEDPSSSTLVPGYLLRALAPSSGNKALVVVPAVRSVKPVFKSNPHDPSYTETSTN